MGILRFLRSGHWGSSIWFRNSHTWLAVLNVGDFDSRWSHSCPALVVA